MMNKKHNSGDVEAELRDAFRIISDPTNGSDTNPGFIGCKEMKMIFERLGEKLDEDQVYDLICEAISNFDGKIYYDGFVKIMIAK